MISQSENFLKY